MRILSRTFLVFVGLASALVAVALAFSWAPDRPVADLTARWAAAPSRFVDVQGMKVHMRDEGARDDPVPIVLLHGTSASLHTWQGWVDALKDRRRVIRLDLPGFALTGPNAGDDYRIPTYVSFVRAFADKMGLQRFVLAGNSLGGEIAWSVAAAMPQRVEKLVLVDSAGYPMELVASEQKIPIGFQIARMPALRPVMENVLPRFVVASSVRNVYGDPAKVTDGLVDVYYDMAVRQGNRRALAARMAQRNTSDPAQIKGLRMPTLILWGGRDRLTPLAFGKWFERDIAGSRLVVFEDLGHVPHEEDPPRTVAEVIRFLGL